MTLSGNRIIPRSITNSSGDRTIDLDLLLNQNCTVNNNGSILINGLISGNKGLNINGSGLIELKNNNTYTGSTILSGGTLKISGSGTLGNGSYGGYMIINGIFDYSSSANQIITSIIGTYSNSNPTLYNPNQKIIMNGSGRLSFRCLAAQGISPNPAFPNCLFSGLIEINSGYLRVGNNDKSGMQLSRIAGLLVGQNGTFEYNSTEFVTVASNTLDYTNAVISGNGNIIFMSGQLTLSGKGSTFDGNITINSGATAKLTRNIGASFTNNGKLEIAPTTRGNWNSVDPVFSKTINGSTTNYTLDVDFSLSTGGAEGNATAEIQSVGLGSDASDFSGFVSGRIALIQRGVSTFQTKVTNAINAGASAVIIYNDTTGIVIPSITSSIPVISITQTLGEQIINDLSQGQVTSNIDTGYEAGDLAIPEIFNSTVSGTGDFSKSGSSTLIVNSTPNITTSGAVEVKSGVLRVTSSNSIPNSGSFKILSGACLELTGGVNYSRNVLLEGTIASTGISNGGAVRNISGNNKISGNVSLPSNNSRINSDADILTIDSGTIDVPVLATAARGLTFGGSGNVKVDSSINNITSLTKDGNGTLELTATNTYYTSGTTTISAGILKLSGSGSLSTGQINNNSSLVLENNNNFVIANAIAGTGSISKNLNTKVILNGALSHTGVTTVNEGTLAIGDGGTTGSVSGTTGNFVVNSGANLEINRSNANTFTRSLSGQGSVTILGGGTTTITSNFSHTGGTTISAGTLSVGANGTIGSLTGDVINNSNLQFYRTDTVSYSDIISGTGNVIKLGNGSLLVLSGNNTYSGTTTCSQGTIRINNSNALGTSSVSVVSNAIFELDNQVTVGNSFSITGSGTGSVGAIRSISDNNTVNGTVTLVAASRINSDLGLLTLNGNISGAFTVSIGGSGNSKINGIISTSTLTKDGSGSLELTNTNSYTTTTISAGTLKLSGTGSFGSGAVTNNSSLVVENNNNFTISNSISGTGSITKNLNNKVIFTGTLSHTGVTTVDGGTFAVGAGSTIGDVSGATGNFVINSGTTLEINRSNASTFARALSGAGSLAVLGGGTASFSGNLTHTGGTTVSAGTMSIGAGSTIGSITGDIVNNAAVQFNRSDAYTYAGIISGTGNLVKAAAGTTTLTGNNSYSGTTTISAGVLRMGNANALGSSSVSVASGGAAEVTGGFTVTNNFTLNGTGISSGGSLRSISDSNIFSGSMTLGSASSINSDLGLLTLNGNIGGAFGLVIGGAGNTLVNGSLTTVTTLTKTGAGTLELTSANTHTSTTTISGGTLKLTGVGTVGAGLIANNATFVIENNDLTTIPRDISGTGNIIKNLNTKVILTGTITNTGTTTVNGGTLAIGSGGTTGSVSGTSGNFVINSGTTLEINRSNASTFARALSGAGSLAVLGGGTASFSGNLTHTGGTTVSAGTMSIGAGSTIGSITGDIVNNAAVQFTRSDAYTYAGIISGTGNLIKIAAGTITLTGSNSYSGTTTISAGSLRIGHANALGSGTSTVSTPANTALELIGGISLSRNLSSASTGISSGGSLRNISGNNTLDGNYTQTNASRINSDADTLTLSNLGTLSGTFTLTLGGAGNINVQRPIEISTAGLTKDGTGNVVLSAANTYTGTTTLSGGTTRFATVQSLYNNNTANWIKTKIIVNTGAVFAINVGGTNEFTTANVSTLLTNLLSTINNNGLRSGSSIGFDTTNSPTDFTISSNLTDSTGTGAGAVGVVKLGSGTLVLSGSGNTYTGGTIINGGTLKAGDATCFGTGTITVNTGATLDKAGFAISNTIVNNGGIVID